MCIYCLMLVSKMQKLSVSILMTAEAQLLSVVRISRDTLRRWGIAMSIYKDPPPCPSHKGRGVECFSPYGGVSDLFLSKKYYVDRAFSSVGNICIYSPPFMGGVRGWVFLIHRVPHSPFLSQLIHLFHYRKSFRMRHHR